jgi:hypothetical protein
MDGGTNRTWRMMPASSTVFDRSMRPRSKLGLDWRTGFSAVPAVAFAVDRLPLRRLLRACLVT